jgi:hypothetical protein
MKNFSQGAVTVLAMSFEEREGGYEEARGGESHKDDRVAIGGLGFGWGCGGVVLALGAALSVNEGREGQDGCDYSKAR